MESKPNVEHKAGTPDVTFDLLSVLYHALQAIETCERYRDDASEDHEVLAFFDRVISENRALADEAKSILSEHIGKGPETSADGKVDEASQESFPASDAPAY